MPYIASMGIYVVSKDVMLDLLREKFPGANDFGSEVIPGATSLGMRVRSISIKFFFAITLLIHSNQSMRFFLF
jgi:ADP-glucose pyrophosphorylase